MEIKIAPSILSADFSCMGKEIERVENAGADLIHCDVMDGMFVPNITFGPKMIADIRKHTKLILDTHLMVVRPERYVDAFIDSGSDMVTIHVEASDQTLQTLKHIRERGCRCGVVINPETPVEAAFDVIAHCDMVLLMSVHPGFGGQKFIPEVMDKIVKLRKYLDSLHLNIELEVDGGIHLGNIGQVFEAGATIAVAGNAVFKADDVASAIKSLKQGGKI